uniref:Si:ch211-131k2.2 n=1 Tax=Nothobranchius rachovii TaxID=451742 RepID=A0A1A8S9Y3_9TELE
MENWKIQLVVVTFCALIQICWGLSYSAEEWGGSDDWQELVDSGLSTPIESLMKRSKALRFYGLMGKRTATKKPFHVDRRNKGEAFVGLMGRSISRRESLTGASPSTASQIHVSEEPHKQGMIVSVQKPEPVIVHLYC